MKYLLKFNEVVTPREELYPIKNIEHKNLIDPALMTYKEYFDEIQNGALYSYHDEGTYAYSMEKNPFKYYNLKDGTWVKIKNQQIGKLNIEYYKKTELRTYATPISDEDFKKYGKIKEDISFVAYHKDEDLIVGVAQDEWGCILISVLIEYQGNGIGDTLYDLYNHYYPHKSSGGVTPSGEKSVKRLHTRLVKKYLQNGIYSDLVKKGEITATRAKEIIMSADLKQKEKTPTSLSLNYGGSGNLMYYLSDSTVIIFDAAIKDLILSRDYSNQKFMKKLIKCFIYISSFDTKKTSYYNLWSVYADNEKFLKIGLDILLSSGDRISDYYIDKNFDEKTKTMIKNVFNSSNFDIKKEKGFLHGQTCNVIKPKSIKFNFEQMKKDSERWFKKIDKYGEFENLLLEFCHSLTDLKL